MSVRPGWMVECCASAISAVASPNFSGFAALGDDDLLFRHAELLCRLRRNRRADDGRAGLSGDGADIRNMIEMRVRYEDRFGLDHIRGGEADVVRPRRAAKIRVEQIDLALVGEFKIGIAEPPDDDGVGLRRGHRAAGHGGLVAVAGLRDIGRERCARQGQETGARKCRQPYRFHHFILPPYSRRPRTWAAAF